ncbi:Aste57867_8382 [Aphanomyces stellatus]|uniref:Aste57867_8382 protein n=1 Tax=Aphanomyces stellatus TaxID=120398 RepID=A0A485KK39_9STRA|nr:hypothetical protein As57867_008350 [Aphanomyces stellatus]VFT85268.1 Aste57867_8382 [Aphanomyces stellatus]
MWRPTILDAVMFPCVQHLQHAAGLNESVLFETQFTHQVDPCMAEDRAEGEAVEGEDAALFRHHNPLDFLHPCHHRLGLPCRRGHARGHFKDPTHVMGFRWHEVLSLDQARAAARLHPRDLGAEFLKRVIQRQGQRFACRKRIIVIIVPDRKRVVVEPTARVNILSECTLNVNQDFSGNRPTPIFVLGQGH